jgi:hypothetical protein
MGNGLHWTSWFSALLLPLVAVLALYLFYLQWRSARDRIKFALFERRMAVYDATCQFMMALIMHGKVSDDELMQFQIGTRAAKWVLNVDMADYFNLLHRKASEFKALTSNIERLSFGEQRNEVLQKQQAAKRWFEEQYTQVVDGKFAPFLKLKA